MNSPLDVGQFASLACLIEVTIPKPGNVHRGADFEDVTFLDFAVSAVAIAPAMQHAGQCRLGKTVLDAIQATRSIVTTNTNLGIVLLLAPLAKAADSNNLQATVKQVLDDLTCEDSADFYQAIRLANPGGLGTSDRSDVHDPPPACLIEAMRKAEDRDLVARQYAHDYEDVFGFVLPALLEGIDRGWNLNNTVVHAHLKTMSAYPDSLIARKLGPPIAHEAANRAAHVLESGQPGDEAYHAAVAELDFWLRSDGHRRNPGTTADLIAAALFVALLENRLQPPFTVV